MNKEILMSIRPEWLVKILNGEKTVELRKRFPKDYRGWVYLYCTKAIKGMPTLIRNAFSHFYTLDTCYFDGFQINLSGKVVGRVWVDNVDVGTKLCDGSGYVYLPQKSLCLTNEEIMQYANNSPSLTVIYFSKLEIFDKPKELSEFYKKGYLDYIKPCEHPRYPETYKDFYKSVLKVAKHKFKLIKAPQSWQYVYVEDEV